MSTVAPLRRVWSRSLRALITALIAALLVAVGVVAAPAPAYAASQGSGFGTWAPVSAYGWHGSMLIDGVHTYCILPGVPLPTGSSTDQGVSGTAAGLSPQQLTGINHLVTRYGQTSDAVQAAAVGWAVKAIANLEETLHHFGYSGDSLAGAIHWTFSALAPEHDTRIQQLAVAYYDEARNLPAGVAAVSGTAILTTDPADSERGSVRVETTVATAIGELTISGATFDATGTTTLPNASPGVEYAFAAVPPAPGRPYTVSVAGHFSVGPAAAVQHFVTAGGQDTAGPAGDVGFDVVAADAAPRYPLFAPTISTQVAARYIDGGPFIDDVTFTGSLENWPRAEDSTSSFLPISATATVYRTESEPPAPTPGTAIPAEAVSVGSLALQTEAGADPSTTVRVSSLWDLPGPGFYTAVWTIDRASQSAEVAAHLPDEYSWVEAFGERSQVVMVPDVSSRAEPTVVAGRPMSDAILIGAPLPADGLVISSAVYRAVDGVPAEDVCTPKHHVWTSEPRAVAEPGQYSVTSPPIDEAGTYFWQETAVDATGTVVSVGTCAEASEISEVVLPPTEKDTPRALAATGSPAGPARTWTGIAVGLLTTGAMLFVLARRRRFVAGASIG
jgi:hypothetical protein